MGTRARVQSAFNSVVARLASISRWIFQTPSDPVFILAVVTAATFVYYSHLGSYPLKTWDESIYASAALNVADHGYWLVPHVNGFDEMARYPFLEKPPLTFWLQAVSILGFGHTEFAVRFPSATAALLTSVVVYLFGRDVYDSTAGLVSALVFVTTAGVYAGTNGARFGATDMLHTLFGSLFIYLAWLAATDRSRLPAIFTGFVASALVLTKGFAAGAFAIAGLPLLVGLWKHTSRGALIAASGTAVVTTFWWPIAVYLLYGSEFVEEIFVEQVLGRLTGKMPQHHTTILPFMKQPYLVEIQSLFSPWVYLFALALPILVLIAIRDSSERRRLEYLFLVWWALSIFALFALTGTQTWYIIPVYVPASVLVGMLVVRAVEGSVRARYGVVVGASMALLAGRDGKILTPVEGGLPQVAIEPKFDWLAVAVIGVVVLSSFVLVRRDFGGEWTGAVTSPWSVNLDRVRQQLVVALLLLVVVGALVGTPPTPASERNTAIQTLGTTANEVVPAGEPVYIQNVIALGRPLTGFAYYANRPLRSVVITEFRNFSATQYALVQTESIPALQRRHSIIVRAEHLEWALVKLEGTPD